MTSNSKSVEASAADAVANIRALLERGLREKPFAHYISLRDRVRLGELPGDPSSHELTRNTISAVDDLLHSVLQILRNELPKTLDALIDDLQREFRDVSGPTTDSHPVIPITPRSATVAGAMRPPMTNSVFEPTPASETSTFATHRRSRSGTPSPQSNVFDKDKKLDRFPSASVATLSPDRVISPESFTLPSLFRKRPSGPENPHPTPKKRAKISPNRPGVMRISRTVSLREVGKDECIFKRSGYTGHHVLRCSRPECKKELNGSLVVFTSHPFRNELALSHFSSEGHDIESEADIFHKFAVRVVGATGERNTNKNDIRASLAGPSDHRTGLKSPASISKASTDKGKQPEKPLNFFQQPRPAVSSPRANPGLSDDSDFIDEELPAKLTPETFSPRNRINSRGQKRVDYKEKPATIEEFEI